LENDKSKPQKFSFRKRLGSFRYAFKGIRHAFVVEHNFRIHTVATVLVIAAGFYFKVTNSEWIILLFAIGFVLVAELFNSAIEMLADFISPGENKTIGKIKDISAGAVLLAVLISVLAGMLVFWPHIKLLWAD
jgi:diacylglycerol kinase (ATP)